MSATSWAVPIGFSLALAVRSWARLLVWCRRFCTALTACGRSWARAAAHPSPATDGTLICNDHAASFIKGADRLKLYDFFGEASVPVVRRQRVVQNTRRCGDEVLAGRADVPRRSVSKKTWHGGFAQFARRDVLQPLRVGSPPGGVQAQGPRPPTLVAAGCAVPPGCATLALLHRWQEHTTEITFKSQQS